MGSTTAPVLRLSGITKRFGKLIANDAISLTLARGEVLALLGENGAGKSTLMSILFGHYVADEGSIEVFGKPLPPGQPRAALAAGIGMVHQHFTLADNLTVLDNVLLGSEPLWQPFSRRSEARTKLLAVSQQFGLPVSPDAKVGSLSVGERQRVEILKALYRGARILILDEPTAVLTPQESEALFGTLAQMVAHHSVGGCKLQAGDLFGSGTLSGPAPEAFGSLLESTFGGKQPLQRPGGEQRTFLQDGDEVIFRAWCEREGYPRIGFGECRGVILPAR